MNNNVSENPLFNYLNERLPFFLNNLELIKELKNYSSLLKTYLSSRVSTRSYSPIKTQLRDSLNKIYRITSENTGIFDSNTLRGFEQVENKVGSENILKHVYYTNTRIIKKNKHSKRSNLPYLLNEAIINIVLEYVCRQEGRNDVAQFRGFTKVRETNRSESSNINWNYEMEKIQGITLHEYITSPGFDIGVLIEILHQVLDILRFLQRTCGFFHGDLNSSNVMLTTLEDGSLKVKLIDFGFSLIDTNYLNNQRKYVLTNTRDLNTNDLFIRFSPSNGNINGESKVNLKFVDFYHLLFFVYKDLKKSRKIKIANKLKATFQFPEGINLNRIEEHQIHGLTRKYDLIPYEFTRSNRNLDDLLEAFRGSLVQANFNNNNSNGNSNGNENENENENNGNNFFQRRGGPRGLSYGNNGSGNNGSGNGFFMSRGRVQSPQSRNRGQNARRELNLAAATASHSPPAIRRPLYANNNSNNEEGTPKKRGRRGKGLFNS